MNNATLGAHLREQHGIFGGVSGRRRGDRRTGGKRKRRTTPEIRSVAVVPVPDKPAQLAGLAFVDSLRVAIGDDGSMWICEKVREGRG
jgi:hypothetical protein